MRRVKTGRIQGGDGPVPEVVRGKITLEVEWPTGGARPRRRRSTSKRSRRLEVKKEKTDGSHFQGGAIMKINSIERGYGWTHAILEQERPWGKSQQETEEKGSR